MSRSVKILWRLTFGGILAFILLIVLINFGVFGKMPSITELQNPSALLASEIYADDASLMGKYYLEDRSPVEFKEISPNVIHALIATEDERFYEHSGIDGRSILRSVKGVVTLNQDGGGSTITQQLALNLFNRKRATNKFERIFQKLKEWVIAVKLERNFTKDEIITYYLNTVPFGDNVYGIRNAALTFFQKEPINLNVQEAAVLVGMLKGNTQFNPRRHPKDATDRRNTVMEQMVRNDFIKADVSEKLKKKPIELSYKKLDQSSGIAPYFRENVLKEEVRKLLKDKKRPDGESYDIYRDGLKIYTTINPKLQAYAEEATTKNAQNKQLQINMQANVKTGSVWKGHEDRLEKNVRETDRWKDQKEDGMSDSANRKTFDIKTPMKVFAWNEKRSKDTTMSPYDSIKYHRQFLQSGFIAMDPVGGHVKAWVGGIDYKTFKLDHANVNTVRQVGSTIKPMLYSLAVEEAGFTPETPCQNAAQYFPGFGLVPAKGGGSGGSVLMYVALAKSLNPVAAYLMKQVGPKRFADFLQTCNVQHKIEPYPSNALGSCDLSLYEMMWMYTMFAGRGFNTKPQFVTRIEDRNGNVLVQVQPEHKEVISEITAYTMAKMMGGCIKFGTGTDLKSYGIRAEMGAKTGTTNDNSDAWFFAYTPQLLCGTWIGCDDRWIRFSTTALGQGGKAALPAVGLFLKNTYNDKKTGYDPLAEFIKPAVDKNDVIYDYIEGIKTLAAPAEGTNIGNGEVEDYGDYSDTPQDTALKEQKPTNEYFGEEPKKAVSKNDTGKTKTPTVTTPKAVLPPAIKTKPKTDPKKEDSGY